MSRKQCVVCGAIPISCDPCIFILDCITEHTATPLRDVVEPALKQNLKATDFICMKCLELFNEKDRLQKLTTDMDSHIMTKIKDSSKKSADVTSTISVVIGESLRNGSIKEELEKQFNDMKVDNSELPPSKTQKAEPSKAMPKRRRGRPPKVRPKASSAETTRKAPPLMVNHREKRKRSDKFSTFLEVLKGEKDFYIEDEGIEEPKGKKRGGGRKKKNANLDIVPVDQARDESTEKMCVIQVTDMGMSEQEQPPDKEKLDLDEVVQEILGINVDTESSLINGMDNLERDDEDLINVIDEMSSEQETSNLSNSELKKTGTITDMKLGSEDAEKYPTSWPKIKTESETEENCSAPSIEVTEIKEELAVSIPSIEVTITHSEDNTLHTVINDPDVLGHVVQEDALETDVKVEDCDAVVSRVRKYRCKLCASTFFVKDEARKHAQECHKESSMPQNEKNQKEHFKCSDCDRTFPTVRGRDKHYLHMHLRHKPVQCTECSQTFNSFRPLERHLRNQHDKDPILFCEICEAEFVLGTSLEHHKEIVHPVANKTKVIKIPTSCKVREVEKQSRVYECPFCKQEIFGARALRIHHQKVHNNQEYSCNYCKYKSAFLSTLKRHMVRVHKALDVKLYRCQNCPARYKDARDLEEHYISVHNAQETFLCQHCGDKFACIDMLRFHRKGHTAFSCKLCHLGFMKEEALDDHVKTVHNCDHTDSTENEGVTTQSENENDKSLTTKDDEKVNSEKENTSGPKVLVIASDGTVQVKEEGREVSAVPVMPSDDVTLHLQQTREGGLEEMDMFNPLRGRRVKDLPKKMSCPVCNKVLTTKFLRTHMLSHNGKLPHKCHVCDKAYAQGTLLRKHMRNRHYDEFLKLGNKNPKKQKVACDFCKKIYDNIYALEQHLWNHMDEKNFECTDCKIKFGMESNLKEHYKSHYFKEAKPCPVCQREFKSIGFFNEHVEKCQKRWKCEHCGLECDTQEYYRKHQRSEHGGENVVRYQCSLCEKSFVERHRYDDHMITHSSEKAFTCHICRKQFKRQRPLNDHLVRAHSDGWLMCNYCSKTFHKQHDLDIHKLKHRREFQCTSCSSVYSSNEALLNHLMVHHSEASYSCPVCTEPFTKQIDLKNHLITHSSSTPNVCQVDSCHKMFRSEALLRNHAARRHQELHYECSVCDRKFSLESDEIRHVATHTNTPLSCEECGRTFRSEALLEKHLVTHTHEKPYECEVCQHTTTTKHQIIRHIQSEHGLSEVSTHVIVNRWKCSVCGKMFVVKGSLLRHLLDHTNQGVEAQGHAIKTRLTPSSGLELSLPVGSVFPATDTASFLDQVSALSWQDITPLLRFHVLTDNENDKGERAAVSTDVWQCPGCLRATQTEDDMRDHLMESSQCQEAVILQLAGGLANTEDTEDEGSAEEQFVNEEGNGTVFQLASVDGRMQYVIMQEEDANPERLGESTKEAPSDPEEEEEEGEMQVLVSVDDSLQHLLQQPANPNIQIIVEDSAPLKRFLTENAAEGENSTASTSSSQNENQDSLPADTSLLNGSEVLLQIADGRLLLQQTVGGVTQYQLVEGVPTPSLEDAPPSLLNDHSTTLDEGFILSD